jgi:uncharacterized membrane protein YcjF (UPF0283 family)
MFQLINLLMRVYTINDGYYARSGHAKARLMHIHIKGMPEVYSSRICQHLEGFLSQ